MAAIACAGVLTALWMLLLIWGVWEVLKTFELSS